MLKVRKSWAKNNISPKLSSYGAWLEEITDRELREAMLAANVNILRRTAPYAYFFAGDFGPGIWSSDFQGENQKYLAALERKELQRGVWFTYPDCNDPIKTTVTAIGEGDIFPAIHYLNQEEFSLLCLPEWVALGRIDQIVAEAGNSLEALQNLLSAGGFLVSIVDYQDFAIQTYDSQYEQYFDIGQ